MIHDPDHPLMQQAAREIGARVTKMAEGRDLNRALLREIARMIYEHRARCRARGLDYPEMVVLPLFARGGLRMYPRAWELDAAMIEGVREELRAEGVSENEIDAGVTYAWPSRGERRPPEGERMQ